MLSSPRLPLVLFLLQACASAPTKPDSIEPLVGSWQLATAVPAGARIPTMSISRDGSVHGNAGVNRYNGHIDVKELTAGRFHLEGGSSTAMGGPQEALVLEASFHQALATADSAKVNGNTLLLQQGERPLLEFRRLTTR